MLASACRWRSRIAPPAPESVEEKKPEDQPKRCWKQLPLLGGASRTHVRDRCSVLSDRGGRMKLLALVTQTKSVMRYLAKLGDPTDMPVRSPNRGPPY